MAMMLSAAYEMTSGRVWSLVGIVVGALGFFALKRGVWAVVLGVVGAVAGLAVVLVAKGGPGTGYGIVGGYVSLVVGLVAVVLGALARRRAARAAAPHAS
jgi:peptidoglycan/LPS O-acetylase OafA/YrhL